MFNFILVSFCFLLMLGFGSVIGLGFRLGIGLGFRIGNLKKYLIGGTGGTVDIPSAKCLCKKKSSPHCRSWCSINCCAELLILKFLKLLELHKISNRKLNTLTVSGGLTRSSLGGCRSTRTLTKSYHANSYPIPTRTQLHYVLHLLPRMYTCDCPVSATRASVIRNFIGHTQSF